MADLVPIVCGFVLVVALIGLAVVSFPARRFAIAMTFTGLVLAVGVHPRSAVPRRSPGCSAARDRKDCPALRSSTAPYPAGDRAGPRNRRPRRRGRARRAWRRITLAATVVVVAVGNLPVLIGADLVDPALERDEQPPEAWTEAAALDELVPGAASRNCPGPSSGRSRGATPSIHRCPPSRTGQW